ncbi:MAG: hydantoinase B/oxoprolinase family protein [Pseudomonadota bacterium]
MTTERLRCRSIRSLFAVIKNGLDAIIDEVAYTVIRTARSEIVKDVMDFSAAFCDAQGRMVAQAKTIALHLGAVARGDGRGAGEIRRRPA